VFLLKIKNHINELVFTSLMKIKIKTGSNRCISIQKKIFYEL
jgi:hypothetical protein